MDSPKKVKVDEAFAIIIDAMDDLYGYVTGMEKLQVQDMYENLEEIRIRLETFLT